MKPFPMLTDDELIALTVSDHGQLARAYRELREHHVAETTARDRAAILHMAGSIAGDLNAVSTLTPEDLARKAVRIARAIVAEVDK